MRAPVVRLLVPLLLLAGLTTRAPATPSCPALHDPSSRCGQELARGGDFQNHGTIVRVDSKLVIAGYSNHAVTVAAFDTETGRRLYAVGYFIRDAYPKIVSIAAVPGRGIVVVAGYVFGTAGASAYVAAFASSDGRRLWQHRGSLRGHSDGAVVTADETRVYTASYVYQGEKANAWAWRVEALDPGNGQLLWRVEHRQPSGTSDTPLAVAVSRDRLVVVGYHAPGGCGYQARADVYTTSGARVSSLLRRDTVYCSEVQAIALSPDGRHAAAVGYGGNEVPPTTDGLTWAIDLTNGRSEWWRSSQGNGMGAADFAVSWVRDEVLVGESAYAFPENGFLRPYGGAVYDATFVALPTVVAYDGRTGDFRWRQNSATTSTRLGAIDAMTTDAGGRTLYLAGGEGANAGELDSYAGTSDETMLGSNEGFVRAVDLESHRELWTGRISPDENNVGMSGSELSGLVVVGGDAYALGTRQTTITSVEAGRRIWTTGTLFRFPAR